jgi:hypothetical protein
LDVPPVQPPALAQLSSGEHSASGNFGGLSGAKRRKQGKTAAGSTGGEGSKTLIDNDFRRSDPCEIVVPHGAHNPKVAGSNPALATTKYEC